MVLYFMLSPICEVEEQKKINFGLKGGFINFSKWSVDNPILNQAHQNQTLELVHRK
jgi:hypothetical protein